MYKNCLCAKDKYKRSNIFVISQKSYCYKSMVYLIGNMLDIYYFLDVNKEYVQEITLIYQIIIYVK